MLRLGKYVERIAVQLPRSDSIYRKVFAIKVQHRDLLNAPHGACPRSRRGAAEHSQIHRNDERELRDLGSGDGQLLSQLADHALGGDIVHRGRERITASE